VLRSSMARPEGSGWPRSLRSRSRRQPRRSSPPSSSPRSARQTGGRAVAVTTPRVMARTRSNGRLPTKATTCLVSSGECSTDGDGTPQGEGILRGGRLLAAARRRTDGPMSLIVTCTRREAQRRPWNHTGGAANTGPPRDRASRCAVPFHQLHIVQTGFDPQSERWRRYYEILGTGLPLVLDRLKRYLSTARGGGIWRLVGRPGGTTLLYSVYCLLSTSYFPSTGRDRLDRGAGPVSLRRAGTRRARREAQAGESPHHSGM